MTFSREDKRDRLTFRASDQLIGRVEEFAREHGMSKSEVMRRSLGEYLPDEGAGGPADPELRNVYNWLRERSNDRNLIAGKDALGDLSQNLSMNKRFVKSGYLDPLRRDGWIETPNMGVIRVVEPSEHSSSDPTPTNDE